jgi:phosphonate transport system substrate-binding protein
MPFANPLRKTLLATLLFAVWAGAAWAGPKQSQSKVLRMGINPWGTEKEMRDMFRPLLDYLGEHLGVTVQMVVPTTYDELLDRVSAGELDIVAFNSVTYLRSRRMGLPMRYIATMDNIFDGESTSRSYYTGYIFVRKDSPYRSLDDLKGKTFAFVDPSSASGFKMPAAMIGLRKGATPEKYFSKFFFVGDHSEVASAVYYGCVDAGATWDNSYNMNTQPQRFGAAFRIIERTPPIPNDAWAVGPRVDSTLAAKLKRVLLLIDRTTKTRDGRTVLNPALGFPGSGWSERSPQFYENAADLLLYAQN